MRGDMHVIVTGGSSGIGLEVARIYAARGARLTLIARDAARLEKARLELLGPTQLSENNIQIAIADIGANSEISAAVAGAEAVFGPCEVLVACAGIVQPGAFEHQSADQFDAQLKTNFTGTANAVRTVFGAMKARRRGRIMIVSSGAALIGLHGYSAYCASKSALTGFAEALAMEAAGTGLKISLAFPPDTHTPQLEKELLFRSPQAQLLMGKAPPWTAEAVAAWIVGSIDKGRKYTYFGVSITALGLFGPLIKPFLAWWYRLKIRE